MKYGLLTVYFTLFLFLSAQGQIRWNQAYQDYIDQYKDIAIEQMIKYHIPASITLAQGLFESAAGRSVLVTRGNNHFGIKCHGWTGPTTYHDDDAPEECFRVYDSALQSYEDHSLFLTNNSRYSKLFQLDPTDYRNWALGLKECGYATNPVYASKLIQIIELYQLNKLDYMRHYDRFLVQHNDKDQPANRQGALHPISIFNKNYYLIAREGDTFKSIGKEVGISWRKLAIYNERNKHDQLQQGDIIFLKKKRKRAPKSFKHRPHIVQEGESMYTISQKYGIQLKSLYRMNQLSPNYQIYPGASLRIR